MAIKVFLEPTFKGEDAGDGGVRRVVEAQRRWLPEHGVEFVDDIRQAEIVNVHISPLAQTERYLQQFSDVPLVASNHGFYWAEHEWPPWCQKANTDCMELLRQAGAITAPSEWVAQSIRRNTLRRATVAYHGVDLKEWKPLKSRGYVLWNKTRTDPVCDPDAVSVLASRAAKVPFISTFGDKSLGNLKLTGRLPYAEAKELVRAAGVYLCTARETFGIGTLEAMACGVPILGWAWGGQMEFIEHKRHGWLARPGDYDDLETGLEYCLRYRDELGAEARALVAERFKWSDVIGVYADVYQRLLAGLSVERPKVSVIVPAHGLEKFLPEALNSVLAQTFSDWECIIVDDASPDRCGQIADEYAGRDRRFRVIHNETNQYLAGALNTGIAAAQGRYILPLDADNLITPDTLGLLAGALDSDRSTHIAYGNVEFIKPDGERWHSGWPPVFRPDWQLHRRAGDRPSNLIPSTAMYRREVWELMGGYRRRYRTAEDADFWTRATSYGFRARMVTEADTLVYRDREDSMSRVEKLADWSNWYPWARQLTLPPAGAALDPQPPVPSYEPVLISVVIPVGPGHEGLLVDALDSVDAQTFRFWECIVVNDTGAPLPWLPSWAREIITTGMVGVGAARNVGISQARAKLFVPLDSDDTLEPEALARLYEAQQEYRGYVYSDWYDHKGDAGISVWKAPDYDAAKLISNGCLHAVTALYPVEGWREVGGFDETLPAWEDWDFQLRLANIELCGTRIPMPLFTYRKFTGQRREENFANFERGKQAILGRWGDYFEGRLILAGCGSCSKGGGGRIDAPAQTIQGPDAGLPPMDGAGDLAIVEYVGRNESIMTFRAPSGREYRFGALPTERLKYVHKDDVEHFVGMVDFLERRADAPHPQEVMA